jgi:hypothetical protein
MTTQSVQWALLGALVIWAGPALGQTTFPPLPPEPDFGPYVIEAMLPLNPTADAPVAIALGADVAFLATAGGVATYVRTAAGWEAGPGLSVPEPPRSLGFDGTTLLVGGASQVSVFRRTGAGVWTASAPLTEAAGLPPVEVFGHRVAIEGSRALVGSLFDTSGPGPALFPRVASFRDEAGTWVREGVVPVGLTRLFGLALDGDLAAFAGDGEIAFVVAVFRRETDRWVQDLRLNGFKVGAPAAALADQRLVWVGGSFGQAHLLRRTEVGWSEEAVYGGVEVGFPIPISTVAMSGTRALLGTHVLERVVPEGWRRLAYFGAVGTLGAMRGDRVLLVVPPTATTTGTLTLLRSEASPDDTTVPPAPAIVDHRGTRWTLGPSGETLRDGMHVGWGYGSRYAWGHGHLYVYAAGWGWFVWVEDVGWQWVGGV